MQNYHIVDLSLPLKDAGGFTNPAIFHYMNHGDPDRFLYETFGISIEDLGGQGNAMEGFRFLNTHSGTHFDAPWHCTSTVAGKKAMTVDEVHLEWGFGPGVKLDLIGKQPCADINV